VLELGERKNGEKKNKKEKKEEEKKEKKKKKQVIHEGYFEIFEGQVTIKGC
jgi:hypothetical protein